jgi:hypothetical protein
LPADPDRPDNLFEVVPGDRGAHGPFDDRAKPWSMQLALVRSRDWLLSAAAVGAVLAARRR